MSGYEFMEWMTLYRMAPFDGDYKAAGIVSSVIANVNRDPAKRRDPFVPKDFMPVGEETTMKRGGKTVGTEKKQAVVDGIFAFYQRFIGR